MISLNNSSKYCDLVHVRPCRRQLGAATDGRGERQLESAFSRNGRVFATPSAVSTNTSRPARIVAAGCSGDP